MALLMYAALLVVGVALLVSTALRAFLGGVRAPSRRASQARGGRRGSGHQILEERFARGELSIEEYQHCRRVLLGGE